MARIVGVTEGNVRHIIENMRDEDLAEVQDLSMHFSLENLHSSVLRLQATSWVFLADDGEPVAVVGLGRLFHEVAQVYAFGTDRWGEVLLLLTRHVLRYMVPEYVAHFRRAECFALSNREDVRRWMKLLGSRPEATLAGRSNSGADVTVYTWTRDDFLQTQH